MARKVVWQGKNFRVVTVFTPVYETIAGVIERPIFLGLLWDGCGGYHCDIPSIIKQAKEWDEKAERHG